MHPFADAVRIPDSSLGRLTRVHGPPANQTLFSINPFLSNTTHDAWFGTVTTGLSVFISATMLSKVNP
jgi:hypothetical protein